MKPSSSDNEIDRVTLVIVNDAISPAEYTFASAKHGEIYIKTADLLETNVSELTETGYYRVLNSEIQERWVLEKLPNPERSIARVRLEPAE